MIWSVVAGFFAKGLLKVNTFVVWVWCLFDIDGLILLCCLGLLLRLIENRFPNFVPKSARNIVFHK